MPALDLLDDIVMPKDPTRQAIALVAFSAADLEQLGFLMQLSPEIAIAELLRQALAADATESIQAVIDKTYQSSNGRARGAFKHVCAGCGREFDSNRRQLPSRKSWCGRPECLMVAAAERARDYRDRKAQGT